MTRENPEFSFDACEKAVCIYLSFANEKSTDPKEIVEKHVAQNFLNIFTEASKENEIDAEINKLAAINAVLQLSTCKKLQASLASIICKQNTTLIPSFFQNKKQVANNTMNTYVDYCASTYQSDRSSTSAMIDGDIGDNKKTQETYREQYLTMTDEYISYFNRPYKKNQHALYEKEFPRNLSR